MKNPRPSVTTADLKLQATGRELFFLLFQRPFGISQYLFGY
jgi:hypothetical protein